MNKTVKVEFPMAEAVEIMRVLRVESQCLIENMDVFQDPDILKRAQLSLSARERLVTSIEEVAALEEEPADATLTAPRVVVAPGQDPQDALDDTLKSLMVAEEDREQQPDLPLSGELVDPTLWELHHGLRRGTISSGSVSDEEKSNGPYDPQPCDENVGLLEQFFGPWDASVTEGLKEV